MKHAVDRVYALLCLKSDNPAAYEARISFGERYTAKWDEPSPPEHPPGLIRFTAQPKARCCLVRRSEARAELAYVFRSESLPERNANYFKRKLSLVSCDHI
jgi:hypothetical protein